MNNYHIILLMIFITLGMIVFAGNSPAENFENDTEEIRVIGVKMDAEWCGKCRVLNPKLLQLCRNLWTKIFCCWSSI